MLLRQKITIAFLLTSIIPILLIGFITYSHVSKTVEQSVVSGLHVIAELTEGELFLYLDKLKTTTLNFASDGFIRDSLEKLSGKRENVQQTIKLLNKHLLQNKLPLNEDLLYIDIINLHGKVSSSSKNSRVGINEGKEPYFTKGKQNIYINDVRRHEENQLELEIATPLYSRTDSSRLIGVLINHFTTNSMTELFNGSLVRRLGAKTQSRGLGETGETYLVNQDRLMINDSLFVKDASFRIIVDTYPVQMGLKHGKEVKGIWKNYRDVTVIGASMLISIDNFKWILITEQDADEALGQIEALQIYYVVIVIIIFAATLFTALLVSRNIIGPIKYLTSIIETFGEGRADTRIKNIKSHDEIGILAKAFNQMSEKLHKAHTDIHLKNKQLEELSNTDSLTGLHNHRCLKELFQIEFNRSFRYNTPLSCLMIDIDFFKTINDTYGHLFGDVVLRGVASIINDSCRESDIASRYGGEEFVVLLPNTSLEQATAVANKLLESIATANHYDAKNSTSVTVSIGVSHLHDEVKSYEHMLNEADQAMYRAKREGRNRVHVFNKLDTASVEHTQPS